MASDENLRGSELINHLPTPSATTVQSGWAFDVRRQRTYIGRRRCLVGPRFEFGRLIDQRNYDLRVRR
jgi:hypothetical protein